MLRVRCGRDRDDEAADEGVACGSMRAMVGRKMAGCAMAGCARAGCGTAGRATSGGLARGAATPDFDGTRSSPP
jgi:hypothetical protein